MVYVTTLRKEIEAEQVVDFSQMLFNFNMDMSMFQKVKKWGNGATYTKTYEVVPREIAAGYDIPGAIECLEMFNRKWDALEKADKSTLYDKFFIPKRSGGLREINAPHEDLKAALYELDAILTIKCKGLHHTAAYAYVEGRSCIDAVKKHQQNESNWFLKTDFSDFFGSTTKEFVMSMFARIYPFSEIIAHEHGREEFSKALDLCFLNGGLPQGTPISPTITNIMMIPFDHMFNTWCCEHRYVYCRYADDMIISCVQSFKPEEMTDRINSFLAVFGAPFQIKDKKTRYGSRGGSNWNLGVMLNRDNNITIGHANRKLFKTMVFNYLMDRKNGIAWEIDDVHHLAGLSSWYRAVNKDDTDALIAKIEAKTGMSFKQELHDNLYN